jgi:hypothetical protein
MLNCVAVEVADARVNVTAEIAKIGIFHAELLAEDEGTKGLSPAGLWNRVSID